MARRVGPGGPAVPQVKRWSSCITSQSVVRSSCITGQTVTKEHRCSTPDLSTRNRLGQAGLSPGEIPRGRSRRPGERQCPHAEWAGVQSARFHPMRKDGECEAWHVFRVNQPACNKETGSTRSSYLPPCCFVGHWDCDSRRPNQVGKLTRYFHVRAHFGIIDK